jgi:HPt (histidine-containing phosphotransfer) domain-containing protein/two-component sensor histidine kinase
MEKELSSILLRQLKRCKIELDGSPIPAEVFREFLGRVDTSYDDFKERESRYEQVCRQSSDEIATYISKLKQAEALNRQQQLDILNMLRYIRQGIFTITDGRRIHPEYSEYTTELLERSDIAGCDVKEVLLQKAAIDADSLEQILSVLDFSIGAEDVGFSANQHILPRQLILNFPHSREKTVEIDWTPIFNDAGVVEKILVSLRDVSELRMLEKVNLNQQRELEILSQLVSTSSDRFQQFHRNSVTALDHCRSLLEKEGHLITIASLQELYRELHTIKGNARMFGFRGITNLVHESEEHYKVSVHVIHESWNTSDRLRDLAAIRAELDAYAVMAAKAFGYNEKPEQIQRHYFVEKTLTTLRSYQDGAVPAEQALSEIATSIRVFEYSPLKLILESVVSASVPLAQELGKLPPQIDVPQNALGFHRKTHAALESIFNHLVRNSLDHGLEPEHERLHAGKPARGSIHIQLTRTHHGVSIHMQDDGRGLNLNRIQDKAQSLGIVTAAAAMSTEDLAQLIFEPGLSTRAQENQVSGRGMGLSAVRSLASDLGGTIRLELHQKDRAAPALSFVIDLPADVVTELNENAVPLQKAS